MVGFVSRGTRRAHHFTRSAAASLSYQPEACAARGLVGLTRAVRCDDTSAAGGLGRFTAEGALVLLAVPLAALASRALGLDLRPSSAPRPSASTDPAVPRRQSIPYGTSVIVRRSSRSLASLDRRLVAACPGRCRGAERRGPQPGIGRGASGTSARWRDLPSPPRLAANLLSEGRLLLDGPARR